MANLEIIARLKNLMSSEAVKVKEDIKGISQAVGEADVKTAAFTARQRLLASEMNRLSKEVATNKMSVADATKEYEKFEKTLVKIEDVAPQVSDSLDKIDDGANKGSLSWTELNQAVELVKTGFGMVKAVAQEVYEVVGEGAKIQAAQNTFENLAQSIDTTAAALNSTLRQATNGMVSDMDLMAGANRFVAMGLATTEEEAGKLANIATQLGVAFRGDAVVGMEELALMLANQSIPRLDSFGVSAGAVRTRINELMEANQGMTRETAFMTAFMEQAEVTMGKIGDQAETTAAQMATAEANVKNFGDSFKATFSEGLLDNINLVASGLFDTQESATSLGEKLGKIATDVSFLGFLRLIKEEIKEMGEESQRASTSTQQGISGMAGVVAKGMNTVASYSGESKKAAQEMTAQLLEERAAMIASLTTIDDRREAIVAHTQAINASITAISQEAAALYQESNPAYAELQDKLTQTNSLLTEEEAAFRQSQAAAAEANAELHARVEAEEAAAEATRQHEEAIAALNIKMGDYFVEAMKVDEASRLFTESTAGVVSNTQAVNAEMFNLVAASDAGALGIAAAGLALGQFTPQAAEAYLKTAILKIEMDKLAQSFAETGDVGDLVTGMQDAMASVQDLTLSINSADGSIHVIDSTLATTTQTTQAMIDKFGEVPDVVETEIRAETGNAVGATQAFLDKLNSIPRSVDVQVNVHGGDSSGTNYGAGGYQGMAAGGRVEPFKSYLVGDAPGGGITPYTEMFIPDSPGFIVNNETLQRLMGNGQSATPATFGDGGGQASYSDSATIQIVNNFFGAVDQGSVGQLENSQRGIIAQALAERDKRLSAQSRMRS